MKTKKDQRGATPTTPSRRGRPLNLLRSRRKKDGVIKGKLRMRSLPGAFLVLGIMVVAVGTALAVASYWPYGLSKPSVMGPTEEDCLSETQDSGWSLGAKGLLSPGNFFYTERMKMLGPIIIGVGLFILICANTVLYENRDRETQMLLAQMRNVICSVSAAVPSAGLRDMAAANSMAKHYQCVSSLPAAHLSLCVQHLASSEPLLQTRGSTVGAVLQAEAFHHRETESPPSLHSSSSDSWNTSQTKCNPKALPGRSVNLQAAPLPNCDVCLVSTTSMSTLECDGVDISAVQPRRCHSMSCRTNPYRALARLPPLPVPLQQLEMSKAESGSLVCVTIPEEAQTHSSWPRLNLGSGRRYLKLENKEDSVERLLDQQCSSWDKSFGSGPFQ
ncbi:transmembrane protein 200A [Oryzias melastigma]|uniref:Transmembrane protein 200B n=1 Tax=Oryzias melastigma TaxID=30732 RepID=A0A3B3BPH6_ORYME|nr:transmembrane protein 200A [Oryzias melastigma]